MHGAFPTHKRFFKAVKGSLDIIFLNVLHTKKQMVLLRTVHLIYEMKYEIFNSLHTQYLYL